MKEVPFSTVLVENSTSLQSGTKAVSKKGPSCGHENGSSEQLFWLYLFFFSVDFDLRSDDRLWDIKHIPLNHSSVSKVNEKAAVLQCSVFKIGLYIQGEDTRRPMEPFKIVLSTEYKSSFDNRDDIDYQQFSHNIANTVSSHSLYLSLGHKYS